jgi:nickel transport protein
MNMRQLFKFGGYAIVTLLVFFLSVGSALAHKVTIFAWVEGDTVFTQSKFSGGRKAQNSTVAVYGPQGNQLLEGKTDENGEFSFKIPQKTDLKVVLKASMGHQAEWVIPVEEIDATAADRPGRISQNAIQNSAKEPLLNSPAIHTAKSEPALNLVYVQPQELQKIIDQSLDKKLQPLTHMLAGIVDRGPGITEIFGGIGYIFGLVGVGLYVANRHRKNDNA